MTELLIICRKRHWHQTTALACPLVLVIVPSLSQVLSENTCERARSEAHKHSGASCICVTPPCIGPSSSQSVPLTTSFRFDVLTHSFILHRKQSKSSNRGLETSNFLDTLVFDALCSRLVAHSARLFLHFFIFILGGNIFVLKQRRE